MEASSKKVELSEEEIRKQQDKLREFALRFVGFIKSSMIYPPNHRRPKDALHTWKLVAEGLFASQEMVALWVREDDMFVNDVKLGKKEQVVVAYAPELTKRNIRYLCFLKGVSTDELALVGKVFPLRKCTNNMKQDSLCTESLLARPTSGNWMRSRRHSSLTSSKVLTP